MLRWINGTTTKGSCKYKEWYLGVLKVQRGKRSKILNLTFSKSAVGGKMTGWLMLMTSYLRLLGTDFDPLYGQVWPANLPPT